MSSGKKRKDRSRPPAPAARPAVALPPELRRLLDEARGAEPDRAVARHRTVLDVLVAVWTGAAWRCRPADLPELQVPPAPDLRPLLARLLDESRLAAPADRLRLPADSLPGRWVRGGPSPSRTDVAAWEALTGAWLSLAEPLWPLQVDDEGCRLGRDLRLRPFVGPGRDGDLLVAVGAWGTETLALRSTRGGPLRLVTHPRATAPLPRIEFAAADDGGVIRLGSHASVWSLHEACRDRGLPVPPDEVLRDLAARCPARLLEAWLSACPSLSLVLDGDALRLLENSRIPAGVEVVVRTERGGSHPSGALLEPLAEGPPELPRALGSLRDEHVRELPLAVVHELAVLDAPMPTEALLEWHACDPDLPLVLERLAPALVRGADGMVGLRGADLRHVRAQEPEALPKAAARLAEWALERLHGGEFGADEVDPPVAAARRHVAEWVEASGRADLRERLAAFAPRLLQALRQPGRLDWRMHLHAGLPQDLAWMSAAVDLRERQGDRRGAAAVLDGLMPRLLAGAHRDRPEAARCLLHRARLRLQDGRAFQALEDCSAAHALQEECGDALDPDELTRAWGLSFAAAGQPRQALESLEGARRTPEVACCLADLYRQAGREDEAWAVLDEALHGELCPEDEARLLESRGLWAQAVHAWRTLVERGRGDLRPRLLRSLREVGGAGALDEALRLGGALQAEGLYPEATPDLARALVARGLERLHEGDSEAASADLAEAIVLWADLVESRNRAEHRPELAAALSALGTVRSWLGDLEGALREHERALAEYQRLYERAPEEFRTDLGLAFFNRAGTWRRLGDAEWARRDYDRAVVLLEDDDALAVACANRGLTLAETGHLEEAAQDLDRALALWDGESSQEAARTRGWRAAVRARQGDLPAALLDYRTAAWELVQSGAPPAEVADLLEDEARLARSAGRGEEARTALEQARALRPERAELWGELSALSAEAGEARQAIEQAGEALLRAAEDHPQRCEWLYRRGRLRRALGDGEGAAADLVEAARLGGGFDVLLAASSAVADLGRWEEALALAESALATAGAPEGEAGCLAFSARGRALEAMGALHESLADFTRAVRHGREHAEGDVRPAALALLADAYLGRVRVQLELDPVPAEAEADSTWALELLDDLVLRQGRSELRERLAEALLLRARLGAVRGDLAGREAALGRLLAEPGPRDGRRPPRNLLVQLRRLSQECPGVEAVDRVRELLDPLALEDAGPVGEGEWLELLDARVRKSLESGTGDEVLAGYDLLLRACEDLLGARGPEAPVLERAAVAYNNRGTLKARSGATEEALADYGLALARYAELEAARPGADVWLEMARLHMNRAAVYRVVGSLDDSVRDLQEAAELRRRALLARRTLERARRLGQALLTLAQVLLERGRPDPAREALTEAVEALLDSGSRDDRQLRARCLVLRAGTLDGRSRYSWALGDLQEAVLLYEGLLPAHTEDLAETLARQVDLLEAMGRPDAAGAAARRAIDLLEQAGVGGTLLPELQEQWTRLAPVGAPS